MATPITTNLPRSAITNTSPTTERSTSTPTRVRSSRFIETPMDEYTPANSIYETDDEALTEQYDGTRTRVLMRATNAIVHLVVCVLPMSIAGGFLAQSAGTFYAKSSANSITLLVILSLDIILDLLALAQIKRRRPGWALLARLTVGLAYLVLFLVYVALGYAFPPGYSYWGMQPQYSGPVAYLFMWALGVWNLLNTALHRHQIGVDVRKWRTRMRGESVDGAAAPRQRGASRSHEPATENRSFRGRFGRMARGGRGGAASRASAPTGQNRREEIRLSESRRTDQEPKNDTMTVGTASTRSARRPEEAEVCGVARPAPVAAVDDRARS